MGNFQRLIAAGVVTIFGGCLDRLQGAELELETMATTSGSQSGDPRVCVQGLILPSSDNCQLARSHGLAAGEYVIEAIGEVGEDGRRVVQLRAVTTWRSDSAQELSAWYQARPGGHVCELNGSEQALADAMAGLKVGAHFGLLLALDEVATLRNEGVFRLGTHGGYTNGVFFTRTAMSLDDIGRLMAATYEEVGEDSECLIPAWPDVIPDQAVPSDESVPVEVNIPQPIPDGPEGD